MDKPLNENEIALLRRLKTEPHWQSLLKKIKNFGKVPSYYPSTQKKDGVQESNWIYASGQDAAFKTVYLTLNLSKTGEIQDE